MAVVFDGGRTGLHTAILTRDASAARSALVFRRETGRMGGTLSVE